MKILRAPFLGTLLLFLICLLSGFWGCGDTEDDMETEAVEPFNLLSTRTEADMKKLRTEDPELWDKLNREHFINQYGDIPDVHLVADFGLKIVLEEPFTDDEYLAYLEALSRLHPADDIPRLMAERYRKAKADGIPFSDVNADDILAKIDDEKPEEEADE